jgi:hypothetical protein
MTSGSGDPRRVIRASELAQYGYCAKAWWLGSVDGVASTNTEALARGGRVHRSHGRKRWLSRLLIGLALLLLLMALLLLVLG